MNNKSNLQMNCTSMKIISVFLLALITLSVSKLHAQTADSVLYGPLVVIDGKKVNSEAFNELTPDAIHSIDILKDKAAVDYYGEDGKNGVVVIALKKAQKEIDDPMKKLSIMDALYIVDGEKMGADFVVNSIKPDEIDAITILKQNTAVNLYGEEGENGVVIIQRKQSK